MNLLVKQICFFFGLLWASFELFGLYSCNVQMLEIPLVDFLNSIWNSDSFKILYENGSNVKSNYLKPQACKGIKSSATAMNAKYFRAASIKMCPSSKPLSLSRLSLVGWTIEIWMIILNTQTKARCELNTRANYFDFCGWGAQFTSQVKLVQQSSLLSNNKALGEVSERVALAYQCHMMYSDT